MAPSATLRHSRGIQSARVGRAAPAVRSHHSSSRLARPVLSFPSRSRRSRSPMDLLTNMVKISDLPTGLLARKGTRAFPTRVTVRLGRAHASSSRTRVARRPGSGSRFRARSNHPGAVFLPPDVRPRRDYTEKIESATVFLTSFAEKARDGKPSVCEKRRHRSRRSNPRPFAG